MNSERNLKMKTYHVGGFNPINKCKTFEDAYDKAKDDDTIELHKNIELTSNSDGITKDIIIKGNNNTISVPQGKVGIMSMQPIEISDVTFRVEPRANAILSTADIELRNVKVELEGPIREFYPVIRITNPNNNKTKARIENSDVIMLAIDSNVPATIIDTTLHSYYNGDIHLSTSEDCNRINGPVMLDGCKVRSAIFTGNTTMKNTTIEKFVDIYGKFNGKNISFDTGVDNNLKIKKNQYKNEPSNGPLKNQTENRYGISFRDDADAIIDNYDVLSVGESYLSIYSKNASLTVRNTQQPTSLTQHLVVDSTLSFSNTDDNNYWDLENTTSAYVRSTINSNDDHIPATERLQTMIGQNTVKEEIKSIMNTIEMNRNTQTKEFEFGYNMIFAGSPGTGKSTIAEIVAESLFEIGAIKQNKLISATSDELVKGYVGQTGENTRKILDSALGGVLFIDEAYELTSRDGENSFNTEVISVLIRYMEQHRSDLVVIAAGYNKEMKEFLASNPGLVRRFQWIQFEDYTNYEMAQIFEQIRKSYGDTYAQPELQAIIMPLFDKLTTLNLSIPDAKGHVTNGGNGGLVRNVYQRITQARNNRVVETGGDRAFTKEDIAIGFKSELMKAENRRL